jgi:hypothetical protein
MQCLGIRPGGTVHRQPVLRGAQNNTARTAGASASARPLNRHKHGTSSIVIVGAALRPRAIKQKLGLCNLLLLDSLKIHETVLKHSRSRFSLGTKSP